MHTTQTIHGRHRFSTRFLKAKQRTVGRKRKVFHLRIGLYAIAPTRHNFLICTHHLLRVGKKAFLKETQKEKQKGTSLSLQDMPTDIATTIFSHLKLVTLLALLRVNHFCLEHAGNVVKERIPTLKRLLHPPFECLSYSDIVHRTRCSLDNMQIGYDHMVALSDAISIGAFPKLKELALAENMINEGGTMALADALGRGALPFLESLKLANNHQIGAIGMRHLSARMGREVLYNLTTMDLDGINIGDQGFVSFSNVLQSDPGGTLPLLKKLYLQKNLIGDDGITAFASACSNGALPLLNVAILSYNRISYKGMASFDRALGYGSLPLLSWLFLDQNQINLKGMDTFLASQAASHLTLLSLKNNHIGIERGVGQALFKALARETLPSLARLDLSYNPLENDDLQHLAHAIEPIVQGGSGAFASLKHILIDDSDCDDWAKALFHAACTSRGIVHLRSFTPT